MGAALHSLVAATLLLNAPVGNRTRHTDAAGSTALTYDANGNLTADGQGATYTYDSDNRLVAVASSLEPGASSQYTYDPFGRRLSKTTATGTTYFLYDGDQLLAELNSTGRLLRSYVYGTGIDEPLRMRRGRTATYYHPDGLGSIIALSDSTGAVIERVTYDPFGRRLSATVNGMTAR